MSCFHSVCFSVWGSHLAVLMLSLGSITLGAQGLFLAVLRNHIQCQGSDQTQLHTRQAPYFLVVSIQLNLLFLSLFVLGPQWVTLRAYSWLCVPGELGCLYEVPRIEPRLSACKVSTLPTVLSRICIQGFLICTSLSGHGVITFTNLA